MGVRHTRLLRARLLAHFRGLLVIALMICAVVLACGLQAPLGAAPAKQTTTAPPTPRPGILLQVAIIPSSASDDPALEKLAATIDANYPAYGAYVAGDQSVACTVGTCDPSAATIFIRVVKDGNTYDIDSIDVKDGAKIGSESGVADVSKLSASDVAPLLGTPIYANGQLELSQGYQQYVQIVPAPMSSSDPDFSPELIALLSRVGITAIQSSYTIAQLGSAPNATICSRGERYLVYSVDIHQQNANLITGFTKVRSIANAYIADCVTHTTIPFWGESNAAIPTTSASLLAYSAFLAFLVPKFSWVQIGQGSLAFSKIVDVDPGNSVVRNDLAVGSMLHAVDSMCTELQIIQEYRENGTAPAGFVLPSPPASLATRSDFTPFSLPTATPPPPAVQAPPPTSPPHTVKQQRGAEVPFSLIVNTGTSTSTTATTGTAATQSNPLDLTTFTGPLPPPLQCHPS